MKSNLTAAALLVGISLFAAEYNVNGKFAVEGSAKLPIDWTQNTGDFLKPLGTVEIVSSVKTGWKGIKLTSKTKPTHLFSLTRADVTAGDVIEIKARVKGSGQCLIGYYCRDVNGVFMRTKEKIYTVNPEEFTEVKFIDVAADIKDKIIGRINIYIASAPNSTVVFEDVELEIKKPGTDKKQGTGISNSKGMETQVSPGGLSCPSATAFNFSGGEGKAFLRQGAKAEDGVVKVAAPLAHAKLPGMESSVFGEKGGSLVVTARFTGKASDLKRMQFMLNKERSWLLGLTSGRWNFSLSQDGRWPYALMGGEAPAINEWFQVVAVARRVLRETEGRVGFDMELYVNGEKRLSRYVPCRIPLPAMDTPVTIGVDNDKANFKGEVANVAFYDRPLGPLEIAAELKKETRVSVRKPGFVDITPELDSLLAGLKPASPLASFAVTGLRSAAMTGFAKAPEVARTVADLVRHPGTDTAFIKSWNEVSPQLKLAETPDLIALCVEGANQGCYPVAALYDRASKSSIFADRPNSWGLEYRKGGEIYKLENWELPYTAGAFDGKGMDILWQGEDFTVCSRIDLTGPRMEQDLRIENNNPHVILESVDFPRWQLARLPGADTMVHPFYEGQLVMHPTENFTYERAFPAAQNSMQFRAYYNDKTGIYAAMEDPIACAKRTENSGMGNRLLLKWNTRVPRSELAKGGNSYEQSGKAVLEVYRGGWFEAGQIYKRFLEAKAKWWIPELPRRSTPDWFRNNSIWILTTADLRTQRQLLYLRQYFEMPFAIHLVGWTKTERVWPHFNHISDRAAEALKALQTAGLRVLAYSDPCIWTTNDREYLDTAVKDPKIRPILKELSYFDSYGRSGAVKNEKGGLEFEIFGAKKCAIMCPGAISWQDHYAKLCKKIASFGFDGIYEDELPCCEIAYCFDASHGHRLNDPAVWCSGGFWPMFEKIRRTAPSLVHTGEDASDPYLKVLDGYMIYRSVEPDHVPLFQSIYAGRIQFTGRLFNHQKPGDWNSSFAKVGEQFVYGEQLGWITIEDLEFASTLRLYFKRLAHLRTALLNYFNEADMAPFPTFRKPVPELMSKWGSIMTEAQYVKTAKVLSSRWKRADGRTLTIFLNTVDEPVTIEPVDYPAMTLPPYGIELKFSDPSETARLAPVLARIAKFDKGINAPDAKARRWWNPPASAVK